MPRSCGPGAYDVVLVSPDGGLVRGASGVALDTSSVAALPAELDTVVVAGGLGARRAATDPALVELVRDLAARVAAGRRRSAPVRSCWPRPACSTGAGRRRTGGRPSALAARLPGAWTVDADPIFVRDGDVWTSAGVTAGIDLALALVDRRPRRRGRQGDRPLAGHVRPAPRRPERSSRRTWRLGEPSRPRCASCRTGSPATSTTTSRSPRLARHAAMSPRHFARAFRDEIGVTPAAYVEAARVEAAKQRADRYRPTPCPSWPAAAASARPRRSTAPSAA